MKLSDSEKNRLRTKYGEWAVVTGASSGIGLELANQIAGCGINLIISSRQKDKLQEIAGKLTAKHRVKIIVAAADAATTQGIEDIINIASGYNVGLLVVSAGYGTSGEFINTNIEDELNMMRVNCEALLTLTHHYSRLFAENQRGGIVLMSSMVAFQGTPYAANYAATKAYVQTLAEGLAVELRPHNVDVLAAAPGPVASGFGERANMHMQPVLHPEQVGIPILRALGRKTTVLPGGLTKFLVYSLRLLPRNMKVQVMKIVMGGMTQHQRNIMDNKMA